MSNFNKYDFCPVCSVELGTYHYVTTGLKCDKCKKYLYTYKMSDWNNFENNVRATQYEKSRPLFNTIKKANLVLTLNQ